MSSTEDAPSETTETKMENVEDKQGTVNTTYMIDLSEILSCTSNEASFPESQMITEENESTPTVNVTWEEKNKEGKCSDIKKESEQRIGETAGEDGQFTSSFFFLSFVLTLILSLSSL